MQDAHGRFVAAGFGIRAARGHRIVAVGHAQQARPAGWRRRPVRRDSRCRPWLRDDGGSAWRPPRHAHGRWPGRCARSVRCARGWPASRRRAPCPDAATRGRARRSCPPRGSAPPAPAAPAGPAPGRSTGPALVRCARCGRSASAYRRCAPRSPVRATPSSRRCRRSRGRDRSSRRGDLGWDTGQGGGKPEGRQGGRPHGDSVASSAFAALKRSGASGSGTLMRSLSGPSMA